MPGENLFSRGGTIKDPFNPFSIVSGGQQPEYFRNYEVRNLTDEEISLVTVIGGLQQLLKARLIKFNVYDKDPDIWKDAKLLRKGRLIETLNALGVAAFLPEKLEETEYQEAA